MGSMDHFRASGRFRVVTLPIPPGVKSLPSSTRPSSVRSVLHRGAPALLGVLVVVVLGAGALRLGQSNLDAAAQDRVGSRQRLVQAQRNQMASYLDPAQQTTSGQVAFLQP